MKVYLVVECDPELSHDIKGITFDEAHTIIMQQAIEMNEPGIKLVACYSELPKVESTINAVEGQKPTTDNRSDEIALLEERCKKK